MPELAVFQMKETIIRRLSTGRVGWPLLLSLPEPAIEGCGRPSVNTARFFFEHSCANFRPGPGRRKTYRRGMLSRTFIGFSILLTLPSRRNLMHVPHFYSYSVRSELLDQELASRQRRTCHVRCPMHATSSALGDANISPCRVCSLHRGASLDTAGRPARRRRQTIGE